MIADLDRLPEAHPLRLAKALRDALEELGLPAWQIEYDEPTFRVSRAEGGGFEGSAATVAGAVKAGNLKAVISETLGRAPWPTK